MFRHPSSQREPPFTNRVEGVLKGINGIQSMDNHRKAKQLEKMEREEKEQQAAQQTAQQEAGQTPQYGGNKEGFTYGQFYDHVISHLEKPTTMASSMSVEKMKGRLGMEQHRITENYKAIEQLTNEIHEAERYYNEIKERNEEKITEHYRNLEPLINHINSYRSPEGNSVGRGIYPIF